MEFKIEKNIPIPLAKRGKHTDKFPWDAMDVGDSFLINRPQTKACGVCHYAGKVRGWRFATRAVDAKNTRVWRVK